MATLNPADLARPARPRRDRARATAPTCSCSPTSSGSCRTLVLKGGRPVARASRRVDGARLGAATPCTSSASRRDDLRIAVATAARPRVIGAGPRPDRHRRARAPADRRRRRRPWPTRRATWPRSRSSSGICGTGRVGLGFVRGFGPAARRDRARPSPTTRTTSSSWASTTTTWSRAVAPAGASSAAASWPSTAAASAPSCRCRSRASSPTGRRRRCSARAARCDAAAGARRAPGGAVPCARLPGALGDPGAQDHRPRPGRRRPVLRGRPGRGRLSGDQSGQGSTGRPAARQARNPPTMSVASVRPTSCSDAAAEAGRVALGAHHDQSRGGR